MHGHRTARRPQILLHELIRQNEHPAVAPDAGGGSSAHVVEAGARFEPAEEVVGPSAEVALARAPVAHESVEAAGVTVVLGGLRACRAGGVGIQGLVRIAAIVCTPAMPPQCPSSYRVKCGGWAAAVTVVLGGLRGRRGGLGY
jgi:hypothetical protein